MQKKYQWDKLTPNTVNYAQIKRGHTMRPACAFFVNDWVIATEALGPAPVFIKLVVNIRSGNWEARTATTLVGCCGDPTWERLNNVILYNIPSKRGASKRIYPFLGPQIPWTGQRDFVALSADRSNNPKQHLSSGRLYRELASHSETNMTKY